MGNSIRIVGILTTFGAKEGESFNYKQGKLSINLSERQFKVEDSGSWSEEWTMLYTIDDSTCTLLLKRGGKDEGATSVVLIEIATITPDKNGKLQEYGYELLVRTAESDDQVRTDVARHVREGCTSVAIEKGRQIHEGGRSTDTDFYLFGSGDTGGLTLVERKNHGLFPVTLAHYFATSGGINDCSGNKTDVGLSVVVKIRAIKRNLDVTVEGPEQHPALGLRYLFQEAMKTKIWKPTLCPHCANIQKQRSTTTWQSDSDSSESVPVARRHGGSQKSSRTDNNGGKFNGNGNGNYTEKTEKTFILFGWRLW